MTNTKATPTICTCGACPYMRRERGLRCFADPALRVGVSPRDPSTRPAGAAARNPLGRSGRLVRR